MNGYSDRINHALAFAAKHHDQQVRRGTKLPYATQPANLAVMLTRYGCDEETVVAGILLDVVEDYAREAPAEVLQHRVAEKFGDRVLELARMASERRADDDGLELNPDERRDDLLKRVRQASPEGRILVAARALHAVGTLLADLRRTVEAQSIWGRIPGGKARTLEWYRRLLDCLAESGQRSPIFDELNTTVSALDGLPAEGLAPTA